MVDASLGSPDVTVFQRAIVDTEERKLKLANASLRLRRAAKFDDSSGRPVPSLLRSVLTLKTDGRPS